MREALGGLQRQAVDQVDVDAVEAEPARLFNQAARHFERLDAMNRFLHLGMEILNAHAQPVEAEPPQSFEVRLRRHARIDLDADFRVRRERKPFGRETEQAFHLFRRQIRRRAAAPVKLHDGPFAGHESADVLDFPFENFDVRRRDAMILGDDDVAGAEQAQTLAEGKMHVERNRSTRLVGRGVELLEVTRAKIILPDRRRGIARVTWPRPIVFFEKLFGDFEAFPI